MQKRMQLHGIRAKGKRRFKVTTDSHRKLPISPNLLNCEFTVAKPGKAWVGDTTCIVTGAGWLYLAMVIDLFSRHPGKHAGLLFHSDQGVQGVRHHEFHEPAWQLPGHSIQDLLECCVWPDPCWDWRHAKEETIVWLLWHHQARLHSTLACVSPMQFESKWLVRQVNVCARLGDTQSRGKVKL